MGTHYDTPRKARLRGAYDFLRAKSIKYKKKDLYAYFSFLERIG
ncbi:HMG box protein [Colletotrichum asianum]|uniref:HMG box protein n=1 Tax=Colletotrichum asianum TaxID=702518 RepID=A0A8H3W3A5_9PEZI|nr:HMG box protein [Colletotrichum asianum]